MRFLGRSGSHQLADGGDQLLDRFVVTADLAFELIELGGQILVRQHQLPQFHERPNDEHADLHRSRRIEQASGHKGAVLGDGQGLKFGAGRVHSLRSQIVILKPLFRRKRVGTESPPGTGRFATTSFAEW